MYRYPSAHLILVNVYSLEAFSLQPSASTMVGYYYDLVVDKQSTGMGNTVLVVYLSELLVRLGASDTLTLDACNE